MLDLEIILATIIAYLFGSICSAIIVCKIMRLPDPRTQGSRNPGATNVLRIGGKKAAIVTLLGDGLKGFIPVLVAKWLGIESLGLGLVMLAAFLGHLYPIFFRFEGGKGVATLIGCLLALSFPAALSWIITFGIVVAIFRHVSLGSLIASVLTPLFIWYFTDDTWLILITVIMASLLVFRHRSNIEKLCTGQEAKLF